MLSVQNTYIAHIGKKWQKHTSRFYKTFCSFLNFIFKIENSNLSVKSRLNEVHLSKFDTVFNAFNAQK